MQGRLQELTEKRGAREEEAAKRLRDAEERLKASNSALQSAHKEHQVGTETMFVRYRLVVVFFQHIRAGRFA